MMAQVDTVTVEFSDLVRAAARSVIERAARSFGSMDALASQFPFVENYEAATNCAVADLDACSPMRRLQRGTGLSDSAIDLWLAIGLVEEDARFGPLFESVH